MPTLAIIGTGIAGLGCAHFLQHDHDLTVFEQNGYAGGHSHTVDVDEPGNAGRVPVDTGFMVCNRVTYPKLTRLFDALDVPLKPAPMSFSVRHADSGLEFCGTSLNHLFAQRRNLFRPGFWRLLRTIDRFNTEAIAALEDPAILQLSLAQYIALRRYGSDFRDLYLMPMSSAVWSTPPELMLDFPAATLLRFFHNHGFLGLHTQHPWLTVTGGSRTYVEKLSRPWRRRIRLGDPVAKVWRDGAGVRVETRSGWAAVYDQVIFACHADQALRLLGDPLERERRVLGAFRYYKNAATLHTDASVMPRTPRAWSSWNYEIAGARSGPVETATHYWMNALQGVSQRENYFVSINRPDAIAPGKVIRSMTYEHPLFNLEAITAQAKLPDLNRAAEGDTGTFFAGSYFRYGFHEDGFASAENLARQLLGRDPWAAPASPPAHPEACPLVYTGAA